MELIFQTFLREREGGEIKISIAWQYCAISYNGITNRSVVLIIIGTYRRHFTKPWLARTRGVRAALPSLSISMDVTDSAAPNLIIK